ncbi:hypothetical protein LR48_Vigan11g032600 [Vigna angularis]|uniref:Uncharacterized protein n=1 Tax=Phaseolus angularis TaxID=3914 RepID=A0A0L9VRA6_PHAAN|nr:hypothetical protein LR48_Vigan11g032600 [Vigna angularis]
MKEVKPTVQQLHCIPATTQTKEIEGELNGPAWESSRLEALQQTSKPAHNVPAGRKGNRTPISSLHPSAAASIQKSSSQSKTLP